MKIAYFVSRFPHLYQTFIRREINEAARQGAEVTIFPIAGPRRRGPSLDSGCHVSAKLVYFSLASAAAWRAAARGFARRPRPCLRLLAKLVVDTWRRPAPLLKSITAYGKGLALAERIATEGYRHLHAHWATYPATTAMVVSELTGIPFSFAFHAYDLFATRILVPEKIRRAAFVVMNCRFNMEYARSLFPSVPAEKLTLIYNGVDFAAMAPAASVAGAGPPLILAVGQLVPTKGFTYLVEACRLLREQGVEFQAAIVGEGPEHKRLDTQIRAAGLENTVRLEGERPEEDIPAYLSRTACLAMPSIAPKRGSHDGLPNVVIEAMAAGVPVVGTALFGIPEAVEHQVTGLLVPPGDAAALRDAMAALLADPDNRRRMGDAARERSRRRFDVRANVARLGALFEQFARPVDPAGDRRR